MAGDLARPSSTGAVHSHDKTTDTQTGLAVSSALQGHVDYVDLTERVAQGVTVNMPDPASKTTLDTRQLRSTDATSAGATEASPTSTNAAAAKS